jgi:hypothetical protein
LNPFTGRTPSVRFLHPGLRTQETKALFLLATFKKQKRYFLLLATFKKKNRKLTVEGIVCDAQAVVTLFDFTIDSAEYCLSHTNGYCK